MDLKKQIEEELNKTDLSKVDLHLLLELILKHSITFSGPNKLENHHNSFIHNHVLNILYNIFSNKEDTYNVSKNSMGADKIQSLNISKKGIKKDEIIIISILDDNTNKPSYLLTNTTNRIKRKLVLSDHLESEIKIGMQSQPNFIFNSKTEFLKDSKTIHQHIDEEHLEHNDKLKPVFHLISDTIIQKSSLKEAFELLNIQFDFLDKEFEEKIFFYFKDNNNVEKHFKLLYQLNKIKNKNNIKI